MPRCASAPASDPGAGSATPKRSPSTPCGATITVALGRHSSVKRVAVASLTQMTTAARRAATLMALLKNLTLAGWCHSGWSKKVQSWTVTTTGTFARSGIV
jgi:hypothetical protein